MKILTNKSGFSLIELMIVVVIIGLLASIAVPNFKRFQMRSKTTEAKGNLAAIYQAQKSFKGEWSIYFGDFRDIGFDPDGQLRYRLMNAVGGETLPPNYTWPNGATAGNVADEVTTETYCALGAPVTGCSEIALYVEDPAVAAVAIDGTSFIASASGDVDGEGVASRLDEWTIDHNKVLLNVLSDID